MPCTAFCWSASRRACCALALVWEDPGKICSLAVRDDLRRRGLGRRMIAACLDECRELHLKKIWGCPSQAE